MSKEKKSREGSLDNEQKLTQTENTSYRQRKANDDELFHMFWATLKLI